MRRNMVLGTVVVVMVMAMGLALVACPTTTVPAAVGAADALVMQAYDVPAGYGSQAESLMTRLLSHGPDTPPVGRAYLASEGTLVVAAPSSVHEGIPEVLAAFSRAEEQGVAPRNVRITYWLIGADAADSVSFDDLPAPVVDALQPVAGVEPPMTYRPIATQTLVSMDGERASIRSPDGIGIRQTVALAPGGGLVADVNIELPGGAETWTRLNVSPGQVVVFGGSGGDLPREAHDRLFYVIGTEIIDTH